MNRNYIQESWQAWKSKAYPNGTDAATSAMLKYTYYCGIHAAMSILSSTKNADEYIEVMTAIHTELIWLGERLSRGII